MTFRTAAASLSALAISLLLGPWLIRKLREFQVGQVIRLEGPASHRPKAGTPTMGGLLILTAALVPTLLWTNLTNEYMWIAVVITALFGGVGFLDDYLKIVRRDHHGLLPRYKLGLQLLIAAGRRRLVLLWLQHHKLYNTRLSFPFFKALQSGSRLVVRPVHDARPGRVVERRQPDRRPRRPRHQHVSRSPPARTPRSPTSSAIECSPSTC